MRALTVPRVSSCCVYYHLSARKGDKKRGRRQKISPLLDRNYTDKDLECGNY
jgi:hypothetical protein